MRMTSVHGAERHALASCSEAGCLVWCMTRTGLEVAGTVEALGENTTKFSVGDRVGALLSGGGKL